MALDFPANPVDGQVYNNFYYDGTAGAWRSLGSVYAPNYLKNATFTTTTAAGVPLTVQGIASQSGNLQEWKNSSGISMSRIASNGSINVESNGNHARFYGVNSAAGSDQYNFLLVGGNDTGTKAIHFINSSTRTAGGGANGYTIRNDGGPFNLGNNSYTTTIYGNYILKPNQVAFYARGAETSGTLANGGDVPFNNAEVNIGNCFNTSTYRFTAPVSGMYQINTSLFNVGGSGRVSIKVNNASKYNSQNNWDTEWCWAGAIYLNANDYVTVGDWQSLAGASIYYGHSSFSGFLIG